LKQKKIEAEKREEQRLADAREAASEARRQQAIDEFYQKKEAELLKKELAKKKEIDEKSKYIKPIMMAEADVVDPENFVNPTPAESSKNMFQNNLKFMETEKKEEAPKPVVSVRDVVKNF
jgi:hypothetical protein